MPRPPVVRMLRNQAILILIAVLAAWMHSDVAAYSALLGGLTFTLPNAYFIWRAFRYSGASQSSKVVQSLYQGEAWKFVLTALCFGVIFQLVEPLNIWALFITFVTVQLGSAFSAKLANF